MTTKLVHCKICNKEVDANKCWAIHSKGTKTYECLEKCSKPITPLEIDIPDTFIVSGIPIKPNPIPSVVPFDNINDWGYNQPNPNKFVDWVINFFKPTIQYERVKQE